MKLEEIKELAEKGLTNAAIAGAVNLSIRQVQRLKRRLLEPATKPPKTIKALLKILQKKAAQGDLVAIRTLLKEYREPDTKPEATAEEHVRTALHFLDGSLDLDDKETLNELLIKAMKNKLAGLQHLKAIQLPPDESLEKTEGG